MLRSLLLVSLVSALVSGGSGTHCPNTSSGCAAAGSSQGGSPPSASAASSVKTHKHKHKHKHKPTHKPTHPSTHAPRAHNCIARPSGCGYPDQSNTGVPGSVRLAQRSGDIVISSPGTVISGWNLDGSIEVSANNVTIKDVRIANAGSTSNAIHIDGGVSGTRIEDSTLSGRDSGSGSIQYAVANGGDGTVASGLDMYNCSECWNGNGTLENSYAISDTNIPGAHYEAVYVPGGTYQPTLLQHNTLLNPHDQTAGIFGDDHAWGPIHNLTINDNLVADGGDNGGISTGCRGDGNTNVNITNNRLSYIYDSSMASGGYGSGGSWAGNYRDDNLAPVPVAC